MLHIIKSSSALYEVARIMVKSDDILLIESAVYAAVSGHRDNTVISSMTAVHILAPDLEARGLTPLIIDSVIQVDFGGFVALTVANEQSITWE